MTRAKKKAIDALLRNSRQTKQLRLNEPYRPKMPEKGTKISVIHDGSYDLSRIKAIIERYGLEVEFKEVEK
jgi:hypothetical protein